MSVNVTEKLLFSLALLSVSSMTMAASSESCSELSDSSDRLHLQQKADDGICTVKIIDKNPQYPHRTYLWNSEGRVNSSVETKNASGEHTYYIVPVESTLQIQGEPAVGQKYQIKASEKNWSVDKKTSSVNLPEGCQGSIAPGTEKNKGGLSIKSCEGKLVIDSGWRLGASPDLDRTGESTIHDPEGGICTVLNRNIYNYSPGIAPTPKYITSRDWHDYLKNEPKCKNLNIDFLNGTPHSADPRLPATEKDSIAGEKHE